MGLVNCNGIAKRKIWYEADWITECKNGKLEYFCRSFQLKDKRQKDWKKRKGREIERERERERERGREREGGGRDEEKEVEGEEWKRGTGRINGKLGFYIRNLKNKKSEWIKYEKQ